MYKINILMSYDILKISYGLYYSFCFNLYKFNIIYNYYFNNLNIFYGSGLGVDSSEYRYIHIHIIFVMNITDLDLSTQKFKSI